MACFYYSRNSKAVSGLQSGVSGLCPGVDGKEEKVGCMPLRSIPEKIRKDLRILITVRTSQLNSSPSR